MKNSYTKVVLCLFFTLTMLAGCATSDYAKTPPPCDSFTSSFTGGSNPCGPKRTINW